jgi:hypothetical protein
LRFLLGKHGDCQFHALAALSDSSPQEQCAQVLFYGARADLELARNFLVTAALYEQVQDLLVTGRYFYLIQIDHDWFLLLLDDHTRFVL